MGVVKATVSPLNNSFYIEITPKNLKTAMFNLYKNKGSFTFNKYQNANGGYFD